MCLDKSINNSTKSNFIAIVNRLFINIYSNLVYYLLFCYTNIIIKLSYKAVFSYIINYNNLYD